MNKPGGLTHIVRGLSLSILALAALGLSAPAGATEGHSILAGAKGTLLGAFDEGLHLDGGGGLFGEAVLIEHALELELNLRLLGTHRGLDLPVDLLAKVPFHGHLHDVVPYLGAGPAMGYSIDDGATRFGLATAFGVDVWFNARLGMVVELNYNRLYDEGPIHEIGLSLGAVYAL